MSLAGACLTIGKNRTVVTQHAGVHNLFANSLEKVRLRGILGSDVIKCELLSSAKLGVESYRMKFFVD